jgi:hypothetical protein
MSTKTVEPSDTKSARVEARASVSLGDSALPSSTELGRAVYPSLAAITTTWAAFINRRLNENLMLPRQLGDCKNVSSVLRVYGAYCCTAAAEYRAAMLNFQQIGFNLAREISVASLLPIRIAAIQHEHSARSPERAARHCLP